MVAEIPSQLISKKIGPDTWIPTLMVSWALVAIGQFWLSGRPAFLACRFLIGLLQGGFIPDLLLYMSYFWKGTELPFRMALLFTSTRFSSILAPLLAYGVLRLRGYRGQEGWRWLFLVEGLLNLAVGIWSFFMMAASPSQTKRPWRPNGWFTEREEKIMVNRILRDDPSKGDMHNRQPLTPRMIWEALCDYDLWPMYLIGLTFALPSSPPNQYLTLTLRQLGFTTFQTNLLTIPAQFCTALNVSCTLQFTEAAILTRHNRCCSSHGSRRKSTSERTWASSRSSGTCRVSLRWRCCLATTTGGRHMGF